VTQAELACIMSQSSSRASDGARGRETAWVQRMVAAVVLSREQAFLGGGAANPSPTTHTTDKMRLQEREGRWRCPEAPAQSLPTMQQQHHTLVIIVTVIIVSATVQYTETCAICQGRGATNQTILSGGERGREPDARKQVRAAC
jgi:hypothetical protein